MDLDQRFSTQITPQPVFLKPNHPATRFLPQPIIFELNFDSLVVS